MSISDQQEDGGLAQENMPNVFGHIRKGVLKSKFVFDAYVRGNMEVFEVEVRAQVNGDKRPKLNQWGLRVAMMKQNSEPNSQPNSPSKFSKNTQSRENYFEDIINVGNILFDDYGVNYTSEKNNIDDKDLNLLVELFAIIVSDPIRRIKIDSKRYKNLSMAAQCILTTLYVCTRPKTFREFLEIPSEAELEYAKRGEKQYETIKYSMGMPSNKRVGDAISQAKTLMLNYAGESSAERMIALKSIPEDDIGNIRIIDDEDEDAYKFPIQWSIIGKIGAELVRTCWSAYNMKKQEWQQGAFLPYNFDVTHPFIQYESSDNMLGPYGIKQSSKDDLSTNNIVLLYLSYTRSIDMPSRSRRGADTPLPTGRQVDYHREKQNYYIPARSISSRSVPETGDIKSTPASPYIRESSSEFQQHTKPNFSGKLAPVSTPIRESPSSPSVFQQMLDDAGESESMRESSSSFERTPGENFIGGKSSKVSTRSSEQSDEYSSATEKSKGDGSQLDIDPFQLISDSPKRSQSQEYQSAAVAMALVFNRVLNTEHGSTLQHYVEISYLCDLARLECNLLARCDPSYKM